MVTNNVLMWGTFETNSAFPFLPKRIVETNSEGTHRWEFRALSFTNSFDLALPRDVDVDYIRLRQGSPWSTVHIIAKSFRPECGRTSFVLDLHGTDSLVYDSTYQYSNPSYVVRINTNDWPSTNEVRLVYNKVRLLTRAVGVKGKRTGVLLVLGALLLAPIGLLVCKSTKRKKG
jgi:hypothetical protein